MEHGDPVLVKAIEQGRWRELPELSLRDRALCTLAEKLSSTPTKMTKLDWQPLRDLGLDDQACLEVAHVVGLFTYFSRLADGFGVQLDAETRAAAESGIALKHISS